MKLTPEQKKIIDLVNQLPDNLKKETLTILFQMYETIDNTKNDLGQTITSSNMIREAQEKKENMLFFSMPNEKGFFCQKFAKENMNIGETWYAINTENGELVYISGTHDKRAIHNNDFYLKPACEYDYSILDINGPEKFNQIELIEPGKVELFNDERMITKKIKINLK